MNKSVSVADNYYNSTVHTAQVTNIIRHNFHTLSYHLILLLQDIITLLTSLPYKHLQILMSLSLHVYW